MAHGRNRRALDKAVKSLREVQAAEREAAAAPPASVPSPEPVPETETIQAVSPQIGFVPNTPSEPLPAARYSSENAESRDSRPSPLAITTTCRPDDVRYVIGVPIVRRPKS